MPRKTSQRSAAIAEAKTEGSAPRRSGRAVTTKQETAAEKASRSRRSSTAAQTAASVADSKTPRAKGSSRRESTSPSDDRPRGRETPATRVKSARRSTSKINYKESDGEEEVPNTKFDENFESGEDVEESESDEKSKARGRSRSAKTTPKSAEKSKGTSRSRRGRPSKKKDEEEEEEENETFDVSDDSNEPQEVPVKKGRAAKEKEPAKPARNRRQKAEVKTKTSTEDKSKQTRRSGRGSTNKEESTKKRPTRGVQAKHYAEDDDEEVEEISDSKVDDDEVLEMKETEGGRKRKRGASPEEANKRLKDSGEELDEQSKEEVEKEEKDITEEVKETEEEKKIVDEPMDVDVPDSPQVSETKDVKEDISIDKKEEKVDQTDKAPEEEKIEKESTEEKMEQEEIVSPPEEIKQSVADKQDDIEVTSKKESTQSSTSDSVKKIEPVATEVDASQNVKEANKPKEIEAVKAENKIEQPKVEKTPEPVSQPTEQKAEKVHLPPAQPLASSETNFEKIVDKKVEPTLDNTAVKENSDTPTKTEKPTQEERKVPSLEETAVPTVTPIPMTPPKESVTDTTLNGAEQSSTTQKSTNEVPNVGTPNLSIDRTENNSPKANGAHNDVQHTNSPIKDQYYLLPGRKYVINSKLNENTRQAVKNSMFGFVSFNLGTPDSDAYLQKDKLLSELSKLDPHVICLQQVAKPFYNAVLEPSLDALGFKSIFSQPQDSLKGMATFYKSSLFRLSGKSDISLRELVEKEIEASPLDFAQKAAVKSHIRRCGSVLFTHFSTVIGTQTLTVANVQIPRSDFSAHALQISCLAQEVIRINGDAYKPLLLGGEFNIADNDASYQLLKDGYLSNEMIEELQKRKDVALPDNKHDSLVNLLWKSFQHPSSNLCSCYHAVLDHEFIIPELKTVSPDLLWFSSNSLHTVGVLDVVSDKTGDRHLSLKADVAFSI